MDADTVFRCFLEIQKNRKHWLDVIPLIRQEFESSSVIQSLDREKLLQSLGEVEDTNFAGREAVASAMWTILKGYPTFESEYNDYMSLKFKDRPDDRRID